MSCINMSQIPAWLPLEIIRTIFILVMGGVSSYLVREGRLKVNYSRKIVHFSHILSTLFINGQFLNYSIRYFIISGTFSLVQILLFVEPVRSKYKILEFFFLSYDRPEDRPHTVRLAFTQLLAMNLALVGVALFYRDVGLSLELLAVPVFVLAFGDGLAEPVGVRFGKYRYHVNGLFTNRRYTRSIIGSTMVAAMTVLGLIVYRHLFNLPQLYTLLLFMPPLMAWTEAKAPHTWDNPFIFLVGGVAIYLVMRL